MRLECGGVNCDGGGTFSHVIKLTLNGTSPFQAPCYLTFDKGDDSDDDASPSPVLSLSAAAIIYICLPV